MKRVLAAGLIVLGAATLAWAAGPRAVVQSSVERVMAILSESELSEPSSKAAAREHSERRREQTKVVAAGLFDFEEISRRTLARHWALLTPVERAEFTRLFTDLLEQAYIARLEDYSGETLLWTGETVDGGFATVRSKVVTRRGEMPLEYRLHLRDGRWRVYDLMIDGMSFVSIYRSQFDRILRAESFGGLLERLRRKTFETAGVGPGTQGL
ncbi:MAG: MlaC/ttg2D family ABC transporter substrate-binding protein [Candidatus Rokuibacteriota bacterium]